VAKSRKPGLHAQLKEPFVLVHCAAAPHECEASAHSSTSTQSEELLETKPVLHLQIAGDPCDPCTQDSSAPQVKLPQLIREHCTPDPVNPLLHLQVNEPDESAHKAFGLQLCTPAAHSLVLVHPVPLKPGLQVQV
jgi:hypothetical protein